MKCVRMVALLSVVFVLNSAWLLGSGQTTTEPVSENRQYLLERVDDAAIAQIYADGFDTLALKEKILIWHLYNAALAGRDIFYDQRYEYNLEMREVLEEVHTN